MKSFKAGWYLIYTKPRHEKKVHALLTKMNIGAYLPMARKLRTWHDRRKYVDEPLFPSYIFIYLNDIQNYYDGIGTAGVLYYVRSGKEIAQVSEDLINNIRLAADGDSEIKVSEERFNPGQRLVISQGALTGLSCELVEVNCGKMLLVRVELLQRKFLLSLPSGDLMPARR